VDAHRVVVDTNILFSSLLHRESRLREWILTNSGHVFNSPRFVIVEIFKHKERIVAATELDAEELLECLNTILARITFVEEGAIPMGTWV
jgi:predicted nucleic acid-binding protein